MNWYLMVMRDNYANFTGRARRSEYWYFTLFNVIISIVLFALIFVLPIIGFVLYCLYSLMIIIPSLAVTVRRLHDVNKSGWFYFIVFIPLIGVFWLLVLLATEGDAGPNQYGEDPKNQYNEFDKIGASETY